MQASQANDTTVLPRAIVRRSAAIQARYDARNTPAEAENVPADPNAAPNLAAPGNATPADTNPPATTASPPTDPRENTAAYWQQRFNTLQGLRRAEREAHEVKVAEMHQRLTEMNAQVQTLQASTKPADSKVDVTQFFTPEQIEQFGEEQCEAMAKAAMASAQTAVAEAIEKEVKPLQEQQKRREVQSAEQVERQFLDKLSEFVPSWREDNADADWLEWLAGEDEASGLQRQEILARHERARNPERVAKMFKDFAASKAPKPVPPVVGKGNAAGPSGEPPPPASPGAAKPPTDVEVKDFFKRAALGRVKEAERTEFEARMKLRAAAR